MTLSTVFAFAAERLSMLIAKYPSQELATAVLDHAGLQHTFLPLPTTGSAALVDDSLTVMLSVRTCSVSCLCVVV